ncbi:neuroglian-like [Corticium candelabrum]|uniref:neuroglian-like n=1 Tax=Corticium candelabrum TaxID=121492 RepID=UPI002E25BDBD|nr:neuroglian-like [Corticium candelabrum]
MSPQVLYTITHKTQPTGPTNTNMWTLVRSTFLLIWILTVGSVPVDHGSELQFLIKPRTLYLQAAGSRVKLKCKATKESDAVVNWFHGDKKTPISREQIDTTRFVVKRDGTLVIKNTSKSAEGFYYCTITNKLGTKRARAAVAVLGWSQPKIRWKSLFVATVGSNITIPCHKDVSFMGKVYWMSGTNIVYNYLSGNPLPPHLRVYAQYTSLSSIDLKIQQARYSDTGTYTCVLNSIQHPQTTIRQVEVSVLTSELLTNSVQDHPPNVETVGYSSLIKQLDH